MSSQRTTDFASAPFAMIDGDRGRNYPKQNDFFDDGHCLFLNATNVTRTGFDFATCQFITEQKDEVLRKGKLQREDVVLTTRGMIGNVAHYNSAVPYEHMRINSGIILNDVRLSDSAIAQLRRSKPNATVVVNGASGWTVGTP